MPAYQRSSEAPMDFEFTSRPSTGVKPAWAPPDDVFSTPKKRPFADSNAPQSPFTTPSNIPRFGTNKDVPFIFNSPTGGFSTAKPLVGTCSAPAILAGSPSKTSQAPFTPQAHRGTSGVGGWQPPANFSPSKLFQSEVIDVDMEPTPPKSISAPAKREAITVDDGDDDVMGVERPMSKNGLRRVFKKRSTRRGSPRKARTMAIDDDSEESDEEDGQPQAVITNMSHHYTLNIPSVMPQKSELPFLLLGYLQFFFNLSLIIVFLYLIAQFIITVQRDVEHRITEHSLDIVQEISQCTTHYENNFCATRPIPAMIHQCAMWEKCMAQDPSRVGRAKVSAGLIAEVVNSFVDPISWKTLAFTLTSMAFLTLFVNTALTLYRAKLTPAVAAPPSPVYNGHTAHTPFPPPHPAYYPAYGHPAAYMAPPPLASPAPGWGAGWRPGEDQATPTRRRRLEGGVEKVQ